MNILGSEFSCKEVEQSKFKQGNWEWGDSMDGGKEKEWEKLVGFSCPELILSFSSNNP